MASAGVRRIDLERQRQIVVEGHTEARNRGRAEELLRAADAYTQYAINRLANPYKAPELFAHPADFGAWPWARHHWKPDERNVGRNLEKAGALIAAALDSLVEGTDG